MRKRFLVLGAGAVGSYLGGYLAIAGHEVIFLEREKDIPSLRKQGIVMEYQGEKTQVSSVHFSSSLNQILNQKPDLIISALKTYHLDTLLPELVQFEELLPPLLCLQNGVESEQRLANALGSNLIIPGTVTSAVDCPTKGNILIRKMRGIGVAGSHPLAKELVQILSMAGINCQFYKSPQSMKWSKLVTNLLGNASSAILNLTTAQIYSDPALYRIELDQVREALNVMQIQGIKTVNLPGVPVRILTAIIKYLPNWLSQPLLSRMIGGGRGQKMPSFHIDLYSGRGNSEVKQLNGAVVKAGKLFHVPTPVNSFLTTTLQSLIRKELPLETFNQGQEEFLSQLAAHKNNILSM